MDKIYNSVKSKKHLSIIKSSEELFMKFGFKKVTIEDICKKAESSKMTFYKFFKNKNELIKFLIDSWVRDSLEKFDEIEKLEIPFTEKLQMILKMKAESTKKISKEFAQEYFYSNPELKEYIDSVQQQGLIRFIKFIQEAQKKGEVRKSLRPEFFLAAIAQMQELVKNDQLISLYPEYKDFVLEINNFIFYGLMPDEKYD